MARVKGGTVTRKRRKKVLKLAKGYYGSKHTLFKTAKEQVMNSTTHTAIVVKRNATSANCGLLVSTQRLV